MSELTATRSKISFNAQTEPLFRLISPSFGDDKSSNEIGEQLDKISDRRSSVYRESAPISVDGRAQLDLKAQLFDSLAGFKIRISQVAMHSDDEWRSRLFQQLDDLLDSEEWDSEDEIPNQESFATFLRMMLHMRPECRPGLGMSHDGHMVAAWTQGRNRLTIEFLPRDEVRWVLVRYLGEERESAAGLIPLLRLADVLAPYDPDQWFSATRD